MPTLPALLPRESNYRLRGREPVNDLPLLPHRLCVKRLLFGACFGFTKSALVGLMSSFDDAASSVIP